MSYGSVPRASESVCRPGTHALRVSPPSGLRASSVSSPARLIRVLARCWPGSMRVSPPARLRAHQSESAGWRLDSARISPSPPARYSACQSMRVDASVRRPGSAGRGISPSPQVRCSARQSAGPVGRGEVGEEGGGGAVLRGWCGAGCRCVGGCAEGRCGAGRGLGGAHQTVTL